MSYKNPRFNEILAEALREQREQEEAERRAESVAKELITRRDAVYASITGAILGRIMHGPSKSLSEALRETLKIIEELPAEDHGVVRCKDCARYDAHGHRCKAWNHGVGVEDCTPHGMKTPFCPSCGAQMEKGGEDAIYG